MLQPLTSYDRYRSVNGGDVWSPADASMGTISTPGYHVVGPSHLFPTEKPEITISGDQGESYLLSILDGYKLSLGNTAQAALTNHWSFATAAVDWIEPEQEIPIVVKMAPKAVRNVVLKITACEKGVPNPIL